MTLFKLSIYGFLTIVVAVKSENLFSKTQEFKCTIPEPRFISIHELFKENNITFEAVLPVGLTLHRCESFGTCNKKMYKECIPPMTKNVKFSALGVDANKDVSLFQLVAKNVTRCVCWIKKIEESENIEEISFVFKR